MKGLIREHALDWLVGLWKASSQASSFLPVEINYPWEEPVSPGLSRPQDVKAS